jgi:hypothetical protein
MSEQLVGLIVVIILAAIVVLALTKKDAGGRYILFQDVKLVDEDCATVKAMETWEYIYGTGQRTESEVPNLHTLKKENRDWRIAHCDMPESRRAST